MSYEEMWLRAFVTTFLVETPIYWGLLAKRFPHFWLLPLVSLGLQLATHPALWFLAPRFEPYWLWVLVMECLVVLAEGTLVALVIGRLTWEVVGLRPGRRVPRQRRLDGRRAPQPLTINAPP